MSGPRIGELFAGYGGLGMGVQAVLGGDVEWFSEFDAAPSKILAHHWPDVPNHGDITLIDWSTVEPVDILTGGFPCQDVSLAGARRGLKEGTRSGLWSEFARAIAALQPELVVIENVRGLLSADASSGMEPCPECVGNGPDAVSLRALGAVLGDLAELGYDAEWCGLRAADAGAPHGRYRVFILAYPASARRGEGEERRTGGSDEGTRPRSVEPERGGRERPSASANTEHVIGYGSGRAWDGWPESTDGDVTTPDASSDEPERRGGAGELGSAPTAGEVDRTERERVRHSAGDSGSAAADASSERGHEGHSLTGLKGEGADGAGVADEHSPRSGATEWGVYNPAIKRWEAVTGRVAPAPTNGDGKSGSHRLSAQFVEWMMGLPGGHVTDVGLTRNEQLKALGNGVVWQQAALALRVLMARAA